jgi:hypothetical protein
MDPSVEPRIILVPIPIWVGGSSFPRVIGHHPKRESKTPTRWPIKPAPIPNSTENRRAILDEARRLLARRREEQAWREIAS